MHKRCWTKIRVTRTGLTLTPVPRTVTTKRVVTASLVRVSPIGGHRVVHPMVTRRHARQHRLRHRRVETHGSPGKTKLNHSSMSAPALRGGGTSLYPMVSGKN